MPSKQNVWAQRPGCRERLRRPAFRPVARRVEQIGAGQETAFGVALDERRLANAGRSARQRQRMAFQVRRTIRPAARASGTALSDARYGGRFSTLSGCASVTS